MGARSVVLPSDQADGGAGGIGGGGGNVSLGNSIFYDGDESGSFVAGRLTESQVRKSSAAGRSHSLAYLTQALFLCNICVVFKPVLPF